MLIQPIVLFLLYFRKNAPLFMFVSFFGELITPLRYELHGIRYRFRVRI
jgi:hypothetical protein